MAAVARARLARRLHRLRRLHAPLENGAARRLPEQRDSPSRRSSSDDAGVTPGDRLVQLGHRGLEPGDDPAQATTAAGASLPSPLGTGDMSGTDHSDPPTP